jgi:hypothetical protein
MPVITVISGGGMYEVMNKSLILISSDQLLWPGIIRIVITLNYSILQRFSEP